MIGMRGTWVVCACGCASCSARPCSSCPEGEGWSKGGGFRHGRIELRLTCGPFLGVFETTAR